MFLYVKTMAYVKRKPRGTYNRKSRKPVITVKTGPKRVAVARKTRVDQLSRAVRKLQVQQFGSAQTQRQSYRSAEIDLTDTFRTTSLAPCLHCVEAIAPTSTIYSTLAAPGGEYSDNVIGSWVTQPHGLTQLNPLNVKFDLQEFRNKKAFGVLGNVPVQPTYLIKGVQYDIQIFAREFNGWVECWLVKPRDTVLRTLTVERQLPQAIPCFTQFVDGTNQLESHACQFYSYKRKFRMYINTTVNTPEHYLGTNNIFYKKVYVSYGRGKVIRATEDLGSNAGNFTIPLKSQTWMMFASSNPTESSSSFVEFRVARNTHYRDSVGSK